MRMLSCLHSYCSHGLPTNWVCGDVQLCTVAHHHMCVKIILIYMQWNPVMWVPGMKSVISSCLISESVKFAYHFIIRLRRWSFLWMQWPMEFGRLCGLCASAILRTSWGIIAFVNLYPLVPTTVRELELHSLSSASWYGLVIWVSVCVCMCGLVFSPEVYQSLFIYTTSLHVSIESM